MRALEIIDEVPEFARLVALELKRNMTPQDDQISQNKAHQMYGRKWIEKHSRLNNLHAEFRGSRKYYSIAECERVKAKERISHQTITNLSC